MIGLLDGFHRGAMRFGNLGERITGFHGIDFGPAFFSGTGCGRSHVGDRAGRGGRHGLAASRDDQLLADLQLVRNHIGIRLLQSLEGDTGLLGNLSE